MAFTPKKSVRWDFDNASFSDLNSPAIDDGSYDSIVATSSLDYANSQLIAHGFVPAPGLCLDGLSSKESERVVKCLLGMLSQRMEDMSRTEELTTKFRTLTYDHERLTSMHRAAVEKAANTEREMNMHKSRLATTLRTLQTTENAHKQTTAELQRTRTSLQAIRATHQAELKKKEKDMDRMADKWQKLADLQSKLTASPSGIHCVNVAVVEGNDTLGKGIGYLDIALDEAEKARAALLEDNNYLKSLVLKAANSIQRILYQTKGLISETETEIAPYTMTSLFPMSPPTNAGDKISSLLSNLRETLETVSERLINPPSSSPALEGKASKSKAADEEIDRLQIIITNLQVELDRCHEQLDAQAQEMRTIFDKFAEQSRKSAADIGEISMELMSVPLRDEEKDRLERIRKELEGERQKFTEAAIKLGKEKGALEAERLKFLDEKRSWEMDKILADLPPTPLPESPARVCKPSKNSPRKLPRSPKKSPKKSPVKFTLGGSKVGPANGRKSVRISLSSPSKIIPAYETEVMVPLTAPSFPPLQTLAPPSLLPTAFVLPPPSPRASLPSKPALPPSEPISPPELNKDDGKNASTLSSTSAPSSDPDPITPPAVRRAFPMAKPFAQRMAHAYSPAKPSPLSRILMLADSPEGVVLPSLPDISEDASYEVAEESPMNPVVRVHPPEPAMSLAAELGVSESPPDTPLQEKKLVPNVVPSRAAGAKLKGPVFFPESKKGTVSSKDKGKGKAELPAASQRTRTSAGSEKENNASKKVKAGKVSPVFKAPAPTKQSSSDSKVSATKPSVKSSTVAKAPPTKPPPTTRTFISTKALPPAKSGPRRVPIDSAEAPPVAKSRKT